MAGGEGRPRSALLHRGREGARHRRRFRAEGARLGARGGVGGRHLFDNTLGQGEKAQALRAKGNAVIGGTPYTDRLEDGRFFGQEALKEERINILAYPDLR